MERIIVHHSSTIASYGWEEHPAPVLEIEFKSRKAENSIYQCRGVSRQVWLGLLQAPSAGSYYANHIKGKYETVKVQ